MIPPHRSAFHFLSLSLLAALAFVCIPPLPAATATLATNLEPAQAPAPPASSLPPDSPPDLTAFRLISERNIFNPNRSKRTPASENRTARTARRTPRIETVTLVGTLSYEKGDFAFFEGSLPGLSRAFNPGDVIAGFRIQEILHDRIVLNHNESTTILPLRGQLRREDDAPWTVADTPTPEAPSTPASATSATSTDPTATSSTENQSERNADEVLQRLLERRQRELR
jgi:hypothetical protein